VSLLWKRRRWLSNQPLGGQASTNTLLRHRRYLACHSGAALGFSRTRAFFIPQPKNSRQQSMADVLSVSDKINTALLFVTALGVIAAFWQIRAGARAQRATFLKDLYMQLRTDSEVARAFYLIEYGEFTYDSQFHGSELEPKIDRLLTLIDLVCEMRAQKVITKREMNFFAYQFSRVAQDENIQHYLKFLNGFYAQNGLNRKPFSAFQAYAKLT
jgi:hypothetical protein